MLSRIALTLLTFVIFTGTTHSSPVTANPRVQKVSSINGDADSFSSDVVVELLTFPLGAEEAGQILVVSPKNPRATLIMFGGGQGGRLDWRFDGGKLKVGRFGGLLFRNRVAYARAGFRVAFVDAPTIRGDYPRGPESKKKGELNDRFVKAVAQFMSSPGKKLWSVGMSRGAYLAAKAVLDYPELFSGVAIFSPLTSLDIKATTSPATDYEAITILDLPLKENKLPVFLAGNTDDRCPETPVTGIMLLKKRFDHAKPVELVTFGADGLYETSGPCGPVSEHSFWRDDDRVMAALFGFLNKP